MEPRVGVHYVLHTIRSNRKISELSEVIEHAVCDQGVADYVMYNNF